VIERTSTKGGAKGNSARTSKDRLAHRAWAAMPDVHEKEIAGQVIEATEKIYFSLPKIFF
jgi:hypothetical protein